MLPQGSLRSQSHGRAWSRPPGGRVFIICTNAVFNIFVFTRSECSALPSCLACATRSPSRLVRVVTAFTNTFPTDPSTKSSPTSPEGEHDQSGSSWFSIVYFFRANENGGLLTKVEKEKSLLKQELVARIKVWFLIILCTCHF